MFGVLAGWVPDLHGKHLPTHKAAGRRPGTFRYYVHNWERYGIVFNMFPLWTSVTDEANVRRH
jgi:hypothetical protein